MTSICSPLLQLFVKLGTCLPSSCLLFSIDEIPVLTQLRVINRKRPSIERSSPYDYANLVLVNLCFYCLCFLILSGRKEKKMVGLGFEFTGL